MDKDKTVSTSSFFQTPDIKIKENKEISLPFDKAAHVKLTSLDLHRGPYRGPYKRVEFSRSTSTVQINEIFSNSVKGFGRAVIRDIMEKYLNENYQSLSAIANASHLFYLKMGFIPVQGLDMQPYLRTIGGGNLENAIKELKEADSVEDIEEEVLRRLKIDYKDLTGVDGEVTPEEIFKNRSVLIKLQDKEVNYISGVFFKELVTLLKKNIGNPRPNGDKVFRSLSMILSKEGEQRWKHAIENDLEFQSFKNFEQLRPFLTEKQINELDEVSAIYDASLQPRQSYQSFP